MNIYNVFPFSGDVFRKNQERLKMDEIPCPICGRAVSKPYKHTVTIVRGGDWARSVAEETNESDPGYMGVWGVGPNCHKKYLMK